MRKQTKSKGWVNWPKLNASHCKNGVNCIARHKVFHDTGEGGMEAWLVLPREYKPKNDSACITGVCFNLTLFDSLVIPRQERWRLNYVEDSEHTDFSAVILLGSTNKCLWDHEKEDLFKVSKENLTENGLVLFNLITKLFDREPEIMTAIDT